MNDMQTHISKIATALHMPVFSQYEEFIDTKCPFAENLLSLLEKQLEMTDKTRLERRIRYAGFPQRKTLDTFEMSQERLPYLNFDELREIASCDFIKKRMDVVAIGPAGHGKTHVALAIGYEAVKRGYNVRFKRASELINEMNEAKTEKRLADYLKVLNRCQLLIIDEVGYLNYDLVASSQLFQIVGARYETSSTFYTTNLEFSRWPQFIGDEALAAAMIDRIVHHAIILNMNGPSGWRIEHALSKQRGTATGI